MNFGNLLKKFPNSQIIKIGTISKRFFTVKISRNKVITALLLTCSLFN